MSLEYVYMVVIDHDGIQIKEHEITNKTSVAFETSDRIFTKRRLGSVRMINGWASFSCLKDNLNQLIEETATKLANYYEDEAAKNFIISANLRNYKTKSD